MKNIFYKTTNLTHRPSSIKVNQNHATKYGNNTTKYGNNTTKYGNKSLRS